MAEIGKISRENELIKAQLSRARDLGSGGPDREQRRQSTGRKNHQGQLAERAPLLTQVSLLICVASCEISCIFVRC